MNKRILIEGFLPANAFFKKLFLLFSKKSIKMHAFDKILFDKLKYLYEDQNLEHKNSKRLLNTLLKQVNKETGINLKEYVKYYDGIINYLENKSEVTFFDCINSARIFNDFLYQGMPKDTKVKIDNGNFDFESLIKLSFKYNNLYITDSGSNENTLVYKNDGLKVYYPRTFNSFLSTIKNSGYSVSWCTQNEETWMSYSRSQALMIIEIEKDESTEKFGVDDRFRLISLKVNFDKKIDIPGTCDINNSHMNKRLDTLNCFDEIQDAIYSIDSIGEDVESTKEKDQIALIGEFLKKGNKEAAENLVTRLTIMNSIGIHQCVHVFRLLSQIKDDENNLVSLEECVSKSITNICYFNCSINSTLLFKYLNEMKFNTALIFENIIESSKRELKSIYQICVNYNTEFINENGDKKNIFDFITHDYFNSSIRKMLDRKIPDLTQALMDNNKNSISIIEDSIIKRIALESESFNNLSSNEVILLDKYESLQGLFCFIKESKRRGLLSSVNNKKMNIISYLYFNEETLENNNLLEQEFFKDFNLDNVEVKAISSLSKNSKISNNIVNQILNQLILNKDIVNYIKFSFIYFKRDASAFIQNINLQNLTETFGLFSIVNNKFYIENLLKEFKHACIFQDTITNPNDEVKKTKEYITNRENFNFESLLTFDNVIKTLKDSNNENTQLYKTFISHAFKYTQKCAEYLSDDVELFISIINKIDIFDYHSKKQNLIFHITINKMHEKEKYDEISSVVDSLDKEKEKLLKSNYLEMNAFKEDKAILYPNIIKKSYRKIKKYF